MLHNLAGCLLFALEGCSSVLVQQLDSSTCSLFGQVDAPYAFLDSRIRFECNFETAQVSKKLVQQIETTAESKARHVVFEANITVSVDESTPQIARVAQDKRNFAIQAFGIHTEAQQTISQIPRSYREPYVPVLFTAHLDCVYGERALCSQKILKFVEVALVAFHDSNGYHGGTLPPNVQPTISEEKTQPVGSFRSEIVESVGVARVLHLCFAAGSHWYCLVAESSSNVVRTNTQVTGDVWWRFSSEISPSACKLLKFGQPDALFAHTQSVSRRSILKQEGV